jgi:hypothetical protein
VKVRAVRSTGCLGYFSFYICCAMAPCDVRGSDLSLRVALEASLYVRCRTYIFA